METDSFKIGYVMGLIVGEGAFSGDKKTPRLSIKQRDNLLPLQTCVELLGGRIHGPYRYKYQDGKERVYHMWCLDGQPLKAAIPTLEANIPPSIKRDQLIAWKTRYFSVANR